VVPSRQAETTGCGAFDHGDLLFIIGRDCRMPCLQELLVGHALLCAGERQVVWRSGHMRSLSTGVVPLPYPAAECSALLIVDVSRRMGDECVIVSTDDQGTGG
jgi:hypothetical protein